MFFVLITFLLYVYAVVLKARLMDKYNSNLENYINANNPQTNSDVDHLTRQYYSNATQFHFGL
jgi:hypothetical protein